MVGGDVKIRGGVVHALVGAEVGGAAQEAVQGDHGAGIEEVIEGGAPLDTMAVKGLGWAVSALANLLVGVGKPAAGQVEAQVGMGVEHAGDAQFRIEVGRGDGEAEGKVGAQEARFVEVVEAVASQGGRVAFEGLVVAGLDELAGDRINLAIDLRPTEPARQPQQQNPAPAHGGTSYLKLPPGASSYWGSKSGVYRRRIWR
jgi:hypothetical protein